MYSRRSFIRKSKHRKHPNNVILEGRFGIVVLKATTTISNFLTTCAVADGSQQCVESWRFKALTCNIYIYCIIYEYILYNYIYLRIYNIIYLVSQTLTDSEIIDAVLSHKLNDSEDNDDSNGSVDEENKMTMAEAISCCDNLINFME
jgi:hypothetical protein